MARESSRGKPPPRSAQRPAQRARRSDPAREAAYAVLAAVADGAYANLELPRHLNAQRMGGRDAAFATELTYGTLRMQGLYDAIISVAADRPAAGIDGPVLHALRLGAHQILAMRVPDHAAVSATVALVRHHVSQGAGGFANAILRRVSERTREEWIGRVTESIQDPVDRLATQHSHPAWTVRALKAGLLSSGVEAGEVEAALADLLEAQNTPGPLTLAARPGLQAEDQLASAGASASPTAPTAWVWPTGDPGHLEAVRSGAAAVQDAGSQLVALALLAASVEGDSGRWLDLCAGPGGKAGLLAGEALVRGASLRANEPTPHRAELVRSTLAAAQRAGAQIEVTTEDGREVGDAAAEAFDRVLVDAPCTGLGALRRRPEARWRRSPSDLASLGPLQRALLDSAISAARPGGVVLYATCSPHLAETEFVVRDVLKQRQDADLEDVRGLITDRDGAALPHTGPGPWAQLWPHRHDTDGMFMALIRRR